MQGIGNTQPQQGILQQLGIPSSVDDAWELVGRNRVFMARASCGGLCTLSIFLFLLAYSAWGRCYVDPCMEGDGLDTLWKVNKGSSFQIITTSVFILWHSAFCFRLIFRDDYSIKSVDEKAITGFKLACLFVVGLTLQVFVDWISKAHTILDLSQHGGSIFGDRYSESGRQMEVLGSTIHIFVAIAVVSGCMLPLQVFLALYVHQYAEEMYDSKGAYTELDGGAAVVFTEEGQTEMRSFQSAPGAGEF